jgi:CubicO group peptidase (beta-lactamase class C family)
VRFAKILFLAAFLGAGFEALPSAAQTEIAPELLNRPPVAAPTSKIQVGAIPVVLSESQEVDNFTAGLLRGLLADGSTKGAALIVVKDDHVMLQRTLGTVTVDTRFPVGALAGVFDALGAMRLIEGGQLKENQDIGQALGESGSRGMTVAQVLTRQGGDPQLLARAVEKASGRAFYDYATKEIAAPLGMTATAARNGRLETTLADMSHLATALVNGGAYGTGRILEPATVDLMERNHFAPHPAIPGAAYGFPEMLHNGWRALQHDGATREYTARMVIVPEAKVGLRDLGARQSRRPLLARAGRWVVRPALSAAQVRADRRRTAAPGRRRGACACRCLRDGARWQDVADRVEDGAPFVRACHRGWEPCALGIGERHVAPEPRGVLGQRQWKLEGDAKRQRARSEHRNLRAVGVL